jgi:hypothetical protein
MKALDGIAEKSSAWNVVLSEVFGDARKVAGLFRPRGIKEVDGRTI